MEQAEHISLAKDSALSAALAHAAALNKPGTSESELLRYLALVGSENLPEPFVEPTPEQLQRAFDVWIQISQRFYEEQGRDDCCGGER
ncbi:MAG TPA: hypothetical protein VKB03_09290 [Conexibacter sp.]|nr:hypothetical protein [Conexibacter sp.]